MCQMKPIQITNYKKWGQITISMREIQQKINIILYEIKKTHIIYQNYINRNNIIIGTI